MAGLADFFDGKTLSHRVRGFWNQIGGGAGTMEKLQGFRMFQKGKTVVSMKIIGIHQSTTGSPIPIVL
jgi:hypothetical protein